MSTVSIALIGIVGTWALWPFPQDNLLDRLATAPEFETEDDQAPHHPDAGPRAIDPEPFALARLWNPVPPPPEVTDARADDTRLVKRPELQLIGIIEENGERFAALYHVDRKELLIVRSGDRLEPFIIADITDQTVRLEDGRFVASLSVRKDGR